MTIIRTARPDNYTIINNVVFNDVKPLSWDAIGLLCYLLSKPDNWQVSPTQLANTQRCGINKIHNLLKELKQQGFVVGKKSNDGSFNYYVHDVPQTIDFIPNHEKPNQEKPNQEKPNQEKPNQEKPNQDLETLINTEYIQTTDKKLNTDFLQSTDLKQSTEAHKPKKQNAKSLFFEKVELPEFIDRDMWLGWHKERIEKHGKKATQTEFCINQQIKQLTELEEAGYSANACLVIIRSGVWLGINPDVCREKLKPSKKPVINFSQQKEDARRQERELAMQRLHNKQADKAAIVLPIDEYQVLEG